MSKKKLTTYFAVVLSMIFWSLSFIWYKDVYEYLEPITTIFFRLIISATLLLVFSFAIKKLQLIKKTDLKIIFVLAFFEPFLYFIGESIGMKYVSSTTGAVVISLIPLIMPFAAYYFFKEKLTNLNIAGLTISFIGVLFVVLDVDLSFSASPIGLAFLLIGVFAAVGYSVLLYKVLGKYNVISIIAWQNSIGIFMFMPLFFIFDYDHFKTVELSFNVLLPLLELAVFASSLAFILFTYSIKELGIAKTSIFSNLIPAFTAIFAYFLRGDILDTKMIIGIVIVILGLFMSQKKGRGLYN